MKAIGKFKFFLRSKKVDIFFSLILVLAGLKYSFGLEKIIDIGLHDETFYLRAGLNLLTNGFPTPDWGPIYSLWYYFLSFFVQNNIELYYFNYYIQVISLPVLIFLFLRTRKVSLYYSLGFAFLFLISYANLAIWPRVSNFSMMFLLFIFILSSRLSRNWQFLVNSFGVFLASYIRPEFFLSFMILFVLFMVLHVRGKKDVFVLLGTFVFIFLVVGALGNPFGGGRSFAAFRDHFCLNWVVWNESSLDSWKEYSTIMKINFGEAKTILQCVFANPLIVFKHIIYNVYNTFKIGMGLFLVHSNLLIPTPYFFDGSLFALSSINKIPVGIGFIFEAILLLVGIIFILVYQFKKKCKSWSENFKKYRRDILFLGVCMVPSIVSCFFIFSKPHYLLFIVLFSILIILIVVSKVNKGYKLCKEHFFIGVAILLITPKMSVLQAVPTKYCGDRVVSTLSVIKNLNIAGKSKVMSADGDYAVYLEGDFDCVSSYSKEKQNFQKFLDGENFDIVVVTPRLLKSEDYKNDDDWKRFLVNYEQFGYEKVRVKNYPHYLLVKEKFVRK